LEAAIDDDGVGSNGEERINVACRMAQAFWKDKSAANGLLNRGLMGLKKMPS
jgi:hypothetical protein